MYVFPLYTNGNWQHLPVVVITPDVHGPVPVRSIDGVGEGVPVRSIDVVGEGVPVRSIDVVGEGGIAHSSHIRSR